MARAKQTSKRKRREKALPVWGAAGMSLAMAGGASAAIAPTTNGSPQTAAPAPLLTLEEEEISDVSLATFYVFDRENMGAPRLDERIAQRCGRCGGGCRCGGAAGIGRCGGGCAIARCGGCRCGAGCRCGGGWRCGVGVFGCAIGCTCSCSCCISWGSCTWLC
jgi:hypothetical protein